jgi:hypothetical protein
VDRNLRGTWHYGLSSTAAMHYPDFLLVGVAVVISRIMTKLGQQVTKAREMGSMNWFRNSDRAAWAKCGAAAIACWLAIPPSS